MKPIPGRTFMLGFSLLIACVAVYGYLALKNASEGRFAIRIASVPEASVPDHLPLGQPISVRIEKRTAGRSPLSSYAFLLDERGHQIAELQPLKLRDLPTGKTVEETLFSPLGSMPAGRIVAAIVFRIPQSKLPEAQAHIQDVLQLVERRNGQLREVFGNLRPIVGRLGGYVELTQAQVPPLSPAQPPAALPSPT